MSISLIVCCFSFSIFQHTYVTIPKSLLSRGITPRVSLGTLGDAMDTLQLKEEGLLSDMQISKRYVSI